MWVGGGVLIYGQAVLAPLLNTHATPPADGHAGAGSGAPGRNLVRYGGW